MKPKPKDKAHEDRLSRGMSVLRAVEIMRANFLVCHRAHQAGDVELLEREKNFWLFRSRHEMMVYVEGFLAGCSTR